MLYRPPGRAPSVLQHLKDLIWLSCCDKLRATSKLDEVRSIKTRLTQSSWPKWATQWKTPSSYNKCYDSVTRYITATRVLVDSAVGVSVVGRDEPAWRQCDVIDDVAAMDDRHLKVVESVSGERLNVAGERASGQRLMMMMLMKYRRQHELGHTSRHAPVNHHSLLH